jgi:hypothetical protein
MPELKYLITVNSETGMTTKLERVGESGELTPVDLSKLSFDFGGVGGAAVVVNIYGVGAPVAPTSAVNAVKLTDGEHFSMSFPAIRPPGRAR